MELIKLIDVCKSYKEVKAVKGVTLEVNQGEIIGLLGPNGAGKSTTISMMSTLMTPTRGEIYYRNQNIFKNPKAFQKKLGVVPQDIALYLTLSGYKNLKFWGQVYGLKGNLLKQRIEEVSDIIGIGDRLKDRVDQYSGGMKRRINIGAALLHHPEILIMDEPTVGIDPQSRNHILETVKNLNRKGMTVIYTSHYMEEVEYLCDRIYIMDEGKIIASGTKEELIHIIGGNRTISIKLENYSEALIHDLKSIEDIVAVEKAGDALALKTKNGEEIIKEIIHVVAKNSSSILSIDVKKPNLESVFLHLTGKGLRD
ncbi:ABC-2 type transport system ATP-binding protein [Natronincola peptidivorans]|uniref:ABC-2 type transport system ATP-binding protein n=1 Tax=Natronincola peptidivorans TaxID=426128 RepID=A0A1I0H654_9FIRM|nr:ABC transporter ATP-binding protein [Natronincola peptidivorans]SET79157.1 ABC-2 type transport system ATP-binding protein [Natronincola peptidivorans]